MKSMALLQTFYENVWKTYFCSSKHVSRDDGSTNILERVQRIGQRRSDGSIIIKAIYNNIQDHTSKNSPFARTRILYYNTPATYRAHMHAEYAIARVFKNTKYAGQKKSTRHCAKRYQEERSLKAAKLVYAKLFKIDGQLYRPCKIILSLKIYIVTSFIHYSNVLLLYASICSRCHNCNLRLER